MQLRQKQRQKQKWLKLYYREIKRETQTKEKLTEIVLLRSWETETETDSKEKLKLTEIVLPAIFAI